MFQQLSDLQEEARELDALLVTLTDDDWWRPTPFKGWAAFDVLAHLHRTDQTGLLAVTSTAEFIAMRTARIGQINTVAAQREHVQTRDPQVLLADWRAALARLIDALDAGGEKARYQWFGPDMGARSFATARQMEVWAHGQDVYDLLRRPRPYADRLRNVAELGVRTYGWTFVNRQLAPPGPPPVVRLTAPSGAVWTWNVDPQDEANVAAGLVEGLASEFCHVVTQGRNVADTQLRVQGHAALEWMKVAQCFAGKASDPPAKGERVF